MKELTIDAVIENIETVTAFVNAELEAIGCPMKAQIQLDVAIDELFGNIASYAYPDSEGNATVRVKNDRQKSEITVTLIDSGIPFDPLQAQEPDITLPTHQRKVGGLGIHMVKNSMDAVDYEYKDGQNVLTIRKKI